MIVDRSVFARDERLQKVEDLVRCALDRPVRLADAAAAAGLEFKYFSFYFRERTGVCFSDWLASFRVDAAKNLLAQRDLPIGQISQRVGLNDRTLRRLFKVSTGLSPMRYRRSLTAPSSLPRVDDARTLDPKLASLDASELFLLIDVDAPCGVPQTTRKLTEPTRNLAEKTRTQVVRTDRDCA